MNKIPDEFIFRFLNGKLNRAEIGDLDIWISASAENFELFEEYRRIWIGTAAAIANEKFDPVNSWDKVKSKIQYSKKAEGFVNQIRKRRQLKRLLQVAAMGILFLSAGAAGSWFVISKKSVPSTDQFCEIVAPKGSKSLITLPDGSIAWLNAGSKLSYRGDFNQSDRVVNLEGEGYFTVTSNKAKPFIVRTAHLTVKAFGTVFNVKAYPEEKTVEATLIEGVVEIETSGKKKSDETYRYTLKPKQNIIYNIESGLAEKKPGNTPLNDHAVVNRAEVIKKEVQLLSNIKPELYTSWKDENWVIEGMPLDKLAVLMGRRFNTMIDIKDEALKLYKFSGTIQNETLEQVLVILSMTTPLEYSIGKGNVIWSINSNLEKHYTRILKR